MVPISKCLIFHETRSQCAQVALVVRSRDEMVRVGLEDGRVLDPGVADGLEGGPPAQGLEVLGKVVGRYEGEDMGLQGLEVRIVEGLDRRLLHGAVDRKSVV